MAGFGDAVAFCYKKGCHFIMVPGRQSHSAVYN
jgi:hypothetical protein